jgi:hypothetical protein
MDTTSTESLLTAGAQDTTAAATGDQANADATKTADGAASTDAAKTEDGKTDPGKDAAADGDKGKPDAAKDDGKKDGDKPAGAPDTYADFAMPEGYELDAELLGEFTPVLKELNLPQEAAQKVIDFAPKLIEKTVATTQAAVLEGLGLKDAGTWAAAVKADKEIGGEKLTENLGIANKALGQFFSKDAIAALQKVGLGNHPELIRGLIKVGKAVSEDGFVPGGRNTTTESSATRLFDKSNMNP